ncbi:MAG: hypothetical protein E7354_04955 [Clostridiales bacterium]|nr:hypothetical protein [Clostridiales bacterium]
MKKKDFGIYDLKEYLKMKKSKNNVVDNVENPAIDIPQTTDVDYGMVKDVISTIPIPGRSYADETGRIPAAQELVDMSYDAMLEDLSSSIDCRVYDTDKTSTLTAEAVTEFLADTIDTDELQSRNILLTSDMWRSVVLSEKTSLTNGYFQRDVDDNNMRINYSDLSATPIDGDRVGNVVLTSIQFDFMPEESENGYFNILGSSMEFNEKLFSKASESTDVGAIYDTAELARDFSIHKYYLPEGVSDTANASLLFRYDHCRKKHKNGSMPPLYKCIYPAFVEEPHFHFNSGFGGIYKLTNSNESGNYGVGYAIGVSGLQAYLNKLFSGKYDSPQEEKLYTQNDFGMPFLFLLQEKGTAAIGELLERIELLRLTIETNNPSAEVALAYDFTNLMSKTLAPELEFEGIVQDNTNSNGLSDNDNGPTL